MKIRFSQYASGSIFYGVPFNPIELNLGYQDAYNMFTPLDGSQLKDKKYFNTNLVMFSWRRLPNDLKNVSTLVSTLKDYQGKTRYVHFGDIDYRVSGAGWNKYFVDDVDVQIATGGKIRYDITVTLIPEQE